MANWITCTVKGTISKIKEDEIVLPVIQRQLVWNEDKMELLFDSLLRGNSFGSIICIQEEKDSKPLFAYRRFTIDGNDISSEEVDTLSKSQWFIIDGQQRLQSFYIGIEGSFNNKFLFFDLFSDSDKEYDFRFAVNKDKLEKTNKERNQIHDCLWYQVKQLFQRLSSNAKPREIAEEIIKEANVSEKDNCEIIRNNIEDFNAAVFARDSIGISNISVNKNKDIMENRQNIVELFRRLNDGGTKLSSYDLVASIFKGFEYKMEKFLDSIVSDNFDIGIDQDILIKLLFILNDKPSNAMTDLTKEDADFAVSNQDRIKATLEALKKFLHLKHHYSWFSAGKNRSAIPLYFIAHHIFHSKTPTHDIKNIFDKIDTSDKSSQDMAIWLFLSLLNKVFSRGCGWRSDTTGIKKIHKVMLSKKGMPFPKDELLKTYSAHPLRFLDIDKADEYNLIRFDEEYVLYMIYGGEPYLRKVDKDHIHPRSLLLKSNVEENLINNIVNYQMLDSGTNRGEKNDKELSAWINNPACVANKDAYLKKHLIPKDEALWKTENFKDFFSARAKLIVNKLNENL